MKIFNLGSINADHFYRLSHLPQPGETLAAQSYALGLGGKGANQSVAMARAGANVRHIGAIAADGRWMVERMQNAGVDCRHVAELDGASGHAIIEVEASGENAIIIYPGTNRALTADMVLPVLQTAQADDWLVLQNETSAQAEAARAAKDAGLQVVYSAAPFDAAAVRAVIDAVSLLIVNEIEAEQLCADFGVALNDLPVERLVVTLGSKGAVYYDLAAGTQVSAPPFKVTPIDTTGAGDTFAGYLVAGLSEGMPPAQAMRLASAAAALKVTRAGTADAIPARADVDAFLKAQPSE